MFYEQLRRMRKQRGFTIREVADRSGVSAAYISQLENGHRGTPSPDILAKLSEGLESSYADLMKMAGYIERTEEGIGAQKKPINLRRLLREYPIMLDGVELTSTDIRRIDRVLTAMFGFDD